MREALAKAEMRAGGRARGGDVAKGFLLLCLPWIPSAAMAQGRETGSVAIVRQAVAAELYAGQHDLTPWSYRDHDVVPGKDAVYAVVETPQGDLRRMLELNGQPLDSDAAAKEQRRLQAFVDSTAEQAKARKAGDADGAQARAFLAMLPNAFLWRTVSETPEATVLQFQPNPAFSPPDLQARVLSVLAGQMTVARESHRIESLRGTLTDDVKIGFGLFGKIEKGGTFNVERREVAPGFWQITETHVHIGGHALLFKTIGQQEDEVKTGWHRSTAPDPRAALQQLLQAR